MSKNKIITIFISVFMLIILIIPNYINAETTGYNYNGYDYVIDEYNINMVVNEDNTFDITETITAYFNVPKHGIYRKIPLKNTVTRLDGTKSNNRAQISNIYVDNNFTTYNEDGYKVIKIGDASKTFTGSHTYTIKYTYNIGKDPLKNNDELYFNLIGDEWDTIISNISFNIKMPKSFDKSLLGFSSGYTGSTNSKNVRYIVSENNIKGTLNNTLTPGQALTVRITLPEGYFVGVKTNIDRFSILVIGIMFSFVFIAYKLWSKYGKDKQVIETVEFYPPEGYNPAEIGYLYEGVSYDESIMSLLIYLADKGYIRIEGKTKNNNLFSRETIKIIKLKEYDGDNENEKEFLNGLFLKAGSTIEKASNIQAIESSKGNDITWEEAKKRATEDSRTYVTIYELKYNFRSTIDNIKENVQKQFEDKIIEKNSKGKRKWLILMIIVIFMLITIKPILEYSEIGAELLIFALLFPGIGFSVLFALVLGKTEKPLKIFGLIWGSGFGGIPFLSFVLPCLLQNMFSLMVYILGIACVAILILIFKNMDKRTEYGITILGKIQGFKRFIENAEKEQLENLVMKNPEYFYSILSYAYALGVSDKWISQFEVIALQPPQWSNFESDFSINTLDTFMKTTMKTIEGVATESSSSSGSGGSSGGGSSGGGSGGGGGGSW